MNWLYEQPIVVVVLGVLVGLLVGGFWSATGRKELLYVLGIVVLLTIGGLIVERMVVTDREAIRRTLLEIAADVESNDLRRVTRHIASTATQLRARAEAEMPNYKFSECHVKKIHTTDVDASTEPRSAIVEFNVMAVGSFSQGGFSIENSRVPRWVRLHLVKEKDGRWAVENYEHAPPQQFMSAEPLYADPQ